VPLALSAFFEQIWTSPVGQEAAQEVLVLPLA
jgi:hypothetical protein